MCWWGGHHVRPPLHVLVVRSSFEATITCVSGGSTCVPALPLFIIVISHHNHHHHLFISSFNYFKHKFMKKNFIVKLN